MANHTSLAEYEEPGKNDVKTRPLVCTIVGTTAFNRQTINHVYNTKKHPPSGADTGTMRLQDILERQEHPIKRGGTCDTQ